MNSVREANNNNPLCLKSLPPITHPSCSQDILDDARVVAMHQAAEIFEPQTEMVYKYLQVMKGGRG